MKWVYVIIAPGTEAIDILRIILFILYFYFTAAQVVNCIILVDYLLDRFVFERVIKDPQLTPYSNEIPRVLNFWYAASFATSTIIKTYKMNGDNRGVFFLVNNIDFPHPRMRRNGAEKDKARLLDLFNQLGFTLFYYENLKKPEFLYLMQQLSSSEDLRTADCLFLAVLTHGDQ